MRARIGEIDIAYDDTGGGDALVLVHGHPFDRSMWGPQADALGSEGWRIVAPDLRGYGESTVVRGMTPLDVYARDVAGLLDHLGIDRVVIGGLSMGGQIVMEFVRLFPERVRGLVLADTSAEGETREGKKARNDAADRLLREGMGPYADEVLPKMIAPENVEALPAVAEHVLRMMRGTDPDGAAAALRGRAERPDYVGLLSHIAVPVLVVVGSEDEFTPVRDAESMHAELPHSSLVVIEGAGHMPNLERTQEFNAALRGYLESL